MIILLGGSGYVGSAFQRYFAEKGLPCLNLRRSEVDYTKVDTLSALIKQVKANFLICAAGYTGRPNVDACEHHKTECLNGNATLPGIVQLACAQTELPWGHVSSGCIFTGDKGENGPETRGDERGTGRKGFTEEDAPNFTFRQNNCSFYSGSKALGEEVLGYGFQGVRQTAPPPASYIWRLRIPFNHEESPRNYLTKVMRYARLLEATNSLSQLQEFVRACWECFEKGLPYGLYNVTNPGYVTTHEVVDLIKKSGVCAKEYIFFRDESEFMKTAAITPRSNCILDSQKILSYGIQMTPVHDAVEQSLKNWKAA